MSLRSSSPSSQQSPSTSNQNRKMKRRGGIACYSRSTSLPEENVKSSAPLPEGGSQRRLAYSCNAILNKDAQKVRLSLDQSMHFEPESMDVVFDRQGKVVDDHEGNRRFHQLISSYYSDRYQYANTTTHRSLVRIEFLDELKSLGVRFWKRTSVPCVSVDDNEKDTHEESSSHLYSPMNDARTLRRIRGAFETEAIKKSIGRQLSDVNFNSSGESGLRWSSTSETSDGTPLVEA